MAVLLLYLLIILVFAAAAICIWLSRKKSEQKLERDMEKSKDNL
jgi:flagellar basal body-associated protein FliL